MPQCRYSNSWWLFAIAAGRVFCPIWIPTGSNKKDLGRTAALCEAQGADAILIGGSFLLSTNFDPHGARGRTRCGYFR